MFHNPDDELVAINKAFYRRVLSLEPDEFVWREPPTRPHQDLFLDGEDILCQHAVRYTVYMYDVKYTLKALHFLLFAGNDFSDSQEGMVVTLRVHPRQFHMHIKRASSQSFLPTQTDCANQDQVFSYDIRTRS